MAAAFAENGRFIYANAGDSRVYYFHDGKIIAQTKDHSVCQASADMGLIRPEDIRGNEDRSRLLKVLGGEEKLGIKRHYPPIKLRNGDAFLVCTDGFWDYVYEAEMEADLLKSGSADVWLKYMLKRHILRAQNKGDNYTAICGIIHLEQGEVYDDIPEPAKPKPSNKTVPPNKDKKKLPVLPIAIGAIAAAVIALVVCLFILLGKNSGGEEQISTTPAPKPAESITTTTADTTAESTTVTTTPAETAAESTTATPDETNPAEEDTDGEDTDESGLNSESAEGESSEVEPAEPEVSDSENTDAEVSDSESAEDEVSDSAGAGDESEDPPAEL